MDTLIKNLKGLGITVAVEGGAWVARIPAAFPATHPIQTVTFDSCELAVYVLHRLCNHAQTKDKQGFSSSDVEFGHSLAKRVASHGWLTVKQLHHLLREPEKEGDLGGLIRKYKRQLKKFGFVVDALLEQKPGPMALAHEAARKVEKANAAKLAEQLEAGEQPPELTAAQVKEMGDKALSKNDPGGAPVQFPGKVIGSTEKAWKISYKALPSAQETVGWAPKKALWRYAGSLVVPMWKAKQLGLVS